MDKDSADAVRRLMRRGAIRNVNDDGETMTCSVEVAEGIWRDDVEIVQPFGFAAHVPEDGAVGLILAFGGDEGDLVVLPVANPSKRLGGLKPGETAIYNGFGDKQVLKAGGDMDIATGANVNVRTAKGVTVESGETMSFRTAGGKLE